MADNKKSQADKAVTDAKKKTSKTSVSKAADTASKKPSQKSKVVNTETKTKLPGNLFGAFICFGLFLIFLVVSLKPEGWLLQAVQSVALGLIGKIGFYFSIPALLYAAVILVFRSRTNTRMRTICLLVCVVLCGCIFHLSLPERTYDGIVTAVSALYQGGVTGESGGLVCGAVAMLFRWACGNVFSYIIFCLGAVLTLLASMQLTISSLIRAIQNRPRPEWEDETEEKIVREPAEIVVNHIATRQIEHTRQRLQRQAEKEVIFDEDSPEALPLPPAKRQPRKQPQGVMEFLEENPITGTEADIKPAAVSNPKANAMMNQIEVEIGAPVAAAASHVAGDPEPVIPARKAVPVIVEPEDEDPIIPKSMPVYQADAPIPDAPKMESKSEVKEKVTSRDAQESAMQVAAEIEQNKAAQKPEYCFPPIDLLNLPPRNNAKGTDEMRENSRRLNETLASFKIDAHIINVTRGPSVTRYEVELDKGVRLSKLTSCADDIALSLGASGVRIAAVPGKISVVGIEVPNRAVTMVSLREVLDSNEFASSKGKSTFAVGKDIGGSCIVGNIAKMPHMLIAGTTGSGKSVCMNSIIISLLYKAGPEDVKLIMVDPKMVELANYNGIPHLMIPVVTDPKKAAGALQWAVTEMMRRYKTMSDAGVRDLESYNSIVSAEGGEKVPQLIVIIDELADLMMVAAKEVEDSICRIAQMGRASGVHLVIATQRPSADVITGLMKANIPSRIAFSVASAMESRIILDTQGAEKLVGKGDMLFAPIGSGKPLRVQGCFVNDGEVEEVTSYVKSHYLADYDQQVLADIEKKAQQTGKKAAVSVSDPEPSDEELEGDEMLPQAVDVILETGQASVSMLQRRLKLGYARAARIVDEMEEKGIVGPFQGAKPRSILITKEQWEARKGGAVQDQQMDFDDLDDYGVPEDF